MLSIFLLVLGGSPRMRGRLLWIPDPMMYGGWIPAHAG